MHETSIDSTQRLYARVAGVAYLLNDAELGTGFWLMIVGIRSGAVTRTK